MTSDSGQLATYMQLAARLRDRIIHGALGPGDRLPSVRQLAEAEGVARATVERAMRVLHSEGLVEARRGSGTVVAAARPMYDPTAGVAAAVLSPARGHMRGEAAQITGAATVPAPSDVARALRLRPGDRVIRRDSLVLDDGTPSATVTAWFPGELAYVAPALLMAEPIAEGIGPYVERVTGRPVVRGEEHLTARLATEDEAGRLGLQGPTAVLETTHTASDAAGEPLVYAVGLTPPGARTTYRYVVEGVSQPGDADHQR